MFTAIVLLALSTSTPARAGGDLEGPLGTQPTATTCGGVTVAGGDLNGDGLSDTSAGFPVGGLTFQGIDPDEIDFTSTCEPLIVVDDLELHGIDPDEIDQRMQLDLVLATPRATTSGHILLARRTDPHVTGAEPTTEKGTGTLVLELQAMALREEFTRTGEARTLATLTFEVVEVLMDDPGLEPLSWLAQDGTIDEAPHVDQLPTYFCVDRCVETKDGLVCEEVCEHIP